MIDICTINATYTSDWVFQRIFMLQLYIHSANDIVDLESKSLLVPLQKATYVKVNCKIIFTTEDVKRLRIHQRDCKLYYESQGLDHSPIYSYKLCRTECRIHLCKKYCDCIPYYYRRNGESS